MDNVCGHARTCLLEQCNLPGNGEFLAVAWDSGSSAVSTNGTTWAVGPALPDSTTWSGLTSTTVNSWPPLRPAPTPPTWYMAPAVDHFPLFPTQNPGPLLPERTAVHLTSGTSASYSTAAGAPLLLASPPGAPTIGTTTITPTGATVTWTAPTSNGGEPITLYTATSSPGGLTCTSSSTASPPSPASPVSPHTPSASPPPTPWVLAPPLLLLTLLPAYTSTSIPTPAPLKPTPFPLVSPPSTSPCMAPRVATNPIRRRRGWRGHWLPERHRWPSPNRQSRWLTRNHYRHRRLRWWR